MYLNQCITLIALISASYAKIYIHEKFDDGFETRWTYSEDTSVSHGVFDVVDKRFCESGDRAIKAMNDSSYYHLSSPFSEVLNTKVRPLYFQYVAQYEQDIDCGGAYVKLFSHLNPKELTGNSPYTIMIGPDVCGYSTKTLHFIASHNDTNFPLKDKVTFNVDKHPHLISLYIGTDKTFSLKVDGKVEKEGKLRDHFDYLLPEKIDDPTDIKPEDWEDNPTIDDPNDVKPEDWDDRKEISDPDATKPDNWDESTDGEWEPDMIKNPNFKGDWAPKKIKNEKYKGVWAPKQIPNPDFHEDNTFCDFEVTHVGFDLWTVKSGTQFDEIFASDDQTEAEKHSKEVMAAIEKVVEKLKKEEADKPKPQSPISFGGQEDAGSDDSEDAGSDDSEDAEESQEVDEDEGRASDHEDL